MAGGGAPAPKQEELHPHPVKDQLPHVSYCICSPPPWRKFFFFMLLPIFTSFQIVRTLFILVLFNIHD